MTGKVFAVTTYNESGEKAIRAAEEWRRPGICAIGFKSKEEVEKILILTLLFGNVVGGSSRLRLRLSMPLKLILLLPKKPAFFIKSVMTGL